MIRLFVNFELPVHAAGFAPRPVSQIDGGTDFELNNGRKRVTEMDLLENNNTQIHSIDFWQVRPVSTGLGLSLDHTRIPSSDGSALLSLVGDDINRELQKQDAEMDRFLKIQGDQLRHAILDNIQKSQHKTMSLMEEKILQKLNKKDKELEMINRKNNELEVRMEELAMEAELWQQRAKYNESMIAALNYNIEQAQPRLRESIEGCGDSEVEDNVSCFNGRSHIKTMIMCKFCEEKEACMVLFPCKHVCLCKECERKFFACPMCGTSKLLGMEVYM